MTRIGLVGCVKKKLDRPVPAKDLYVSPLFLGRRQYVERYCDRWFILSAKHGVLDPDAVIDPYDETLKDRPSEVRRRWTQSVLAALDEQIGDFVGTAVEIHAGAEYRDHGLMDGLRDRGASVEVPTAGLRLGEQLGFYAGDNNRRVTTPVSEPAANRTGMSSEKAIGGKYAPALNPRADLVRFYALLDELRARLDGPRMLLECDGRMDWPTRGVCFFFEDGESRSGSGIGPRITRVGTHALRPTSKTTLWNRLRHTVARSAAAMPAVETTAGLSSGGMLVARCYNVEKYHPSKPGAPTPARRPK